MKYKLTILMICGLFALSSLAEEKKLPAKFNHSQIFLTAELSNGKQLSFFTDTGGGWNMIRKSSAINAKLTKKEVINTNKEPLTVYQFPEFIDSMYIPSPSGQYFGNGGLIEREDKKLRLDGLLGGKWFADKVWRINYPKQEFIYLPKGYRKQPQDRVAPLGFQVNEQGERTMHFPRIKIKVGNKFYDILLDTGATVALGDEIAQQLNISKGTRIGGSYITLTILRQWQKEHPDWTVIEKSDQIGGATPMIRVPKISIAGIDSGPVWFAARKDHNFVEWMSSMMDKPIVGAIGGSGLKYYDLIIDYPNAQLVLTGANNEKMPQR